MGEFIEYFGLTLRWIFFIGKKDIKVLKKEDGYSYMVGFAATLAIGIFLAFVFPTSCSQKQTDPRIQQFEKVLGQKETKAVNALVEDFEDNLHIIYPTASIQESYTAYLKDLISPETTNWDKFKFQSEKTNYEFHKSGLWDEIYLKENGGIRVNFMGKYLQALFAVKDTDTLIKKYFNERNAAGMLNNELVVPGILSSNPDFTDYFHKRIVVLEFSF